MEKVLRLRVVKSLLYDGAFTLRNLDNRDFNFDLARAGFKDGDIVEIRLAESEVKEPKKQGGDLERQTHGIMTPVGGRKKKGA